MREILLTRNSLDYVVTGHEDDVDAIKRALTFHDPKAFFSIAYQKHRWDGKECFYKEKTNSFPWGLFKTLCRKAPEIVERFRVEDISKKTLINPDEIEFSPNTRLYQAEAIWKFFSENFGILKLPTGSGKTFIASEAIRIFRQFYTGENVFFLVDTKDLLNQSKKTIEEHVGVKCNQIGNGVKEIKDGITVATIQSLNSIIDSKDFFQKERFFNVVRRTRFLIVDEVHEFGSKERANIIRCFNKVLFLLGMSATPYRKSDAMAKYRIMGYTGGIIHEVKEQQLVDEGWLSDRIALIISHKEPDPEKFVENITDTDERIHYKKVYESYIVKNEIRNRIITTTLKTLDKMKVKTLALFSAIEHGKLISEETGFPFICGDDDTETRQSFKENLLKRDLTVLLASNIFNKGIDLPEIKVLFNCGAGKEPTLLDQKKGRVLRKVKEEDRAIIIDLYDDFPYYFDKHSLVRIKTLEKNIPDSQIISLEYDREDFEMVLISIFETWLC